VTMDDIQCGRRRLDTKVWHRTADQYGRRLAEEIRSAKVRHPAEPDTAELLKW